MAFRIILILVSLLMIVFFIVPLSFGLLAIDGDKKETAITVDAAGTDLSAPESAFPLIRSNDEGVTWTSASKTESRVPFPADILFITFHPSDTNTVFLGSKTSGLWRSENRGTSWKKIVDIAEVLDQSAAVHAVAIDKANPRNIYIAAFQYGTGRVLASEDAGTSFREIYFAPTTGVAVYDIAIDPIFPNHLIIGTSQGGVIETYDTGATWDATYWFRAGVKKLYISPTTDEMRYAEMANCGLFKTEDGGKTWKDLSGKVRPFCKSTSSGGFGLFGFTPPVTTGLKLSLDPNRFGVFYVAASSGPYASHDGGETWKRLDLLIPTNASPASQSTVVRPANPNTIFVAANGQIHESNNGGEAWSVRHVTGNRQIGTLVIHPKDYRVFFGITIPTN